MVVAGVTLVALSQLHPSLLLANTTTAGGDTGAHVMLPAFMKSHLLTHGQLTGWDPDWYDGFPLYTFYFPLPGLITVLFNARRLLQRGLQAGHRARHAHPAGVRLGVRAAGRPPRPRARAAWPRPPCPFLFEPSFSIYGGNILSTLAGEFSFSLSLSVALLFLGVVASGLRTGRHRALAAVLFAVTLLCHLIPAIFAGVGAVVWLLLDADLVRGLRRGRRGPAGPAAVVAPAGAGGWWPAPSGWG